LPPPARRPAPTAAGSLGPGRDMWSRLGYGGAGYGGDGGAAAGCGAGHYGGYSSGYGGYGAGYRSGYATVASEDCCAAACGTGAGAGPGGPVDGGADCGSSSCCGGRGTDVLTYVGPGGEYAQETTYRYVGGGAGTFGVVRIPGASSSCCLLLIPLGLLLLLAPLLAWLFWPQTTTTTTTPPVVTTTVPASTTTTIDCDEGDEDSWSDKKKEYCCDRVGKGCPTTPKPPPPTTPPPPPPPKPRPPAPPAPTTTPCPIDCNAGYNDLDPLQWVHGWSAAKKIYCCKVASKGCASELPPPSGSPPSGVPPEPEDREYDCDAGFHDCPKCLKQSWSPKKINWCCSHRGKGCVSST